MKLSQIKKQLQRTWSNGAYIDLPEFHSNERIYITQKGSLYHVKSRADGLHVVPTTLTMSEESDGRWQFNDLQVHLPKPLMG